MPAKLSIIIPVFNEEQTIARVVEHTLAQSFPGWETEVVVVNDGSWDGTEQALQSWMDRIVYERHSTNQGKGAAVRTGYQVARGEAVVVQDADLEYDPANIGALLLELNDPRVGAVYGYRRWETGRGYSWHRWGAALLTKLVNLLYGSSLKDLYACHKLFRISLIRSLTLTSRGFSLDIEETIKLLKRGVTIRQVPSSYYPRRFEHGKKLRLSAGIMELWVLIKSVVRSG